MEANANLLTAFAHRLMSRLDEAADAIKESEEAYRRSGQPSGLGWVLALSGQIDVRSHTEFRPLADIQRALDDVRHHRVRSRLVLTP